jgi:hypothetical protein
MCPLPHYLIHLPHNFIHLSQGVVRENVKRMVRATVTACGQAGAVFRTEATWNMQGEDFVDDKIAQWVSDAGGMYCM